MATYPEDPKPQYPLIVEPEWRTFISTIETGAEQRRQKSVFPIYNVQVNYNVLSEADAQTIWEFYMARKGAYEAFYIYDLTLLADVAFNHVTQYCGTGDGSTDIFDIPGRSTSAHAVYSDGVLQADPGDYSILTGGGVSSSDRVDFVSAPDEGKIITCDFTGFLRIRARFLNDKLSRDSFTTNLFRYGVELKGLKPA